MNFKIVFYLNDNSQVESGEIIKTPQEYKGDFLSFHGLSCTLTLDEDSVSWSIEDELPYIIVNLFLKPISVLQENGCYNYSYWEVDGTVSVRLVDEEVVISGDFIEILTLSLEQYLNISIQLANHTIELLEKFDDSKFQPDIDYIQEALTVINKTKN